MREERIKELINLQRSLNYKFNNSELLNKALTHKSYSNEISFSIKNNERLEYLGDSVLDLIVGNYMFLAYEELPEGPLSKIRAAVVNENCLKELAKKIDLGIYLLLGKGECLSGGKEKASILANAYEAIVGAVFCDSDFQITSNIFLPQLVEKIKELQDVCTLIDFKSDLQEYTQNKFSCIPLYDVVGEMGPCHDKRFDVRVTVRSQVLGSGRGRSKKEAEQNAAKKALRSFSTYRV
mgnify:CR=1 FL=1